MKNELITIDNNNLPIIEWEGKRVITLAMIDKLHGKADGAAWNTLTNHRRRFILNRDGYLLKGKKVLDTLPEGTVDRRASQLWLITETGYLLLIKIMRDDRAWDVHQSVVTTYFNQNKAESYQYDN